MKSELKTRCEMAMMGFTQKCSNEELKDILTYCTSAIGCRSVTPQNIIEEMFKYCSDGYKVHHFVFNTIYDMRVLTVTIETKEDNGQYNLTDEDGVFSSVYNFDCPDCSELGYSFFQNQNGRIKRIA